jgi:hypothetical protein
MNNLNKVRINGKVRKYPEDMWNVGALIDAEFPKHVWVDKQKDKYIIYMYENPQFDKPNFSHPDYWMEYKNVYDTPERLLHQLRHMNAKNWFTNRMTVELMDAVNKLHKKLTGKQHWGWAYGKDE